MYIKYEKADVVVATSVVESGISYGNLSNPRTS